MKQKKYDESFKQEAVNIALSGELSYVEVARDLGVNYSTLKTGFAKA
jgi:transposase